jgi:hypothetical protein
MSWFKRANTPDAPVTPTRALDTAFTPSATKFVLCIYTIQCVGAAGTSSTVELRSDNATTPTTVRCSAMLAVTGAGDSDTVRQLLVYLCPPGDNVKLVSSGAGVLTIAHQTEVATC